jgi:hypothetical protein
MQIKLMSLGELGDRYFLKYKSRVYRVTFWTVSRWTLSFAFCRYSRWFWALSTPWISVDCEVSSKAIASG